MSNLITETLKVYFQTKGKLVHVQMYTCTLPHGTEGISDVVNV